MNTTWKSRLGKLETLLKGSARKAFEIATELRELWNDKTFLAEACSGKPDEAEQKLSKFADATGYHLNELLQMLEHFPNQADWKDGQLRHLYDETCKAIAGKRKSRSAGSADDNAPHRRRVSLAEYEALEREKQDSDRRAKDAEKRAKELQAEVSRLREENLLLIKKIPPPRAA